MTDNLVIETANSDETPPVTPARNADKKKNPSDSVSNINGGDRSYMRDVHTDSVENYVHNDDEPDLNIQIERLKAALHNKHEQMLDLQRGLQAQVHMVMELEELEQKEVADFKAKIEANKRLIQELGERVGHEAKEKAELETRLEFANKQLKDNTDHIKRLEDLHQSHIQIIQQMNTGKQAQGTAAHLKPRNSVWEVYTKVEDLMQKNHTLAQDLQKANDEKQKIQQQVLDKELLCLELSSQLDKMASSLNNEDELMAQVKVDLEKKEQECQNLKERVTLLETSLLEVQVRQNHNNMHFAIYDYCLLVIFLLEHFFCVYFEFPTLKKENEIRNSLDFHCTILLLMDVDTLMPGSCRKVTVMKVVKVLCYFKLSNKQKRN